MLFLISYLGSIIGYLIPRDNTVWGFYILLREIIIIVTSKVLQVSCCQLLSTPVQEQNEMYKSLFRDTLKPKDHRMTRYPHIINHVGLLVNSWCMRFESKHRPSKIASRATYCRKNILESIVLRHQLQLCHRLIQNIGFTLQPKNRTRKEDKVN